MDSKCVYFISFANEIKPDADRSVFLSTADGSDGYWNTT